MYPEYFLIQRASFFKNKTKTKQNKKNNRKKPTNQANPD